MRGRKRQIKKAVKKQEVKAAKKGDAAPRSCKSCGSKKKATPSKPAAPKSASSSAARFSYYGKSKVCHIVIVDDKGVVTALCGDVWTPGDEKAAPDIIDELTDDRRLCKKCEKKQ
ncbi:MAG: hypothetical protein PF442_08950 [Desulfobulbaceae bacterium]|nr:hypothetical protein [Desulfobulbaceae bacterium]